MENKSVYISYAEEDVAYAKWLSHVFGANGLTCYLSDHSEVGMESMTAHIDASATFVLLYSGNLKKIDYSSKETEYAFNSGKCIFPVVVRKCSLDGQYSYYLSRFDRFELYKSRAKNMRLLVGQIKNAIKSEASGKGEFREAKYDVSLLTEKDIDGIIAGERKHSLFAMIFNPFARTYSNNPTVKYAIKCFRAIFGFMLFMSALNGCAEVSTDLLEMTMGEPFGASDDLMLVIFLCVFFYGLWNLSYFPSVVIAKLQIKKKPLIVLASVLTICMMIMLINILWRY